MIPFLRYWLPLLVWMFIIFSASADTQSTARTSRFLEPILRWLYPDISPDTVNLVRLIARKAAHAVEYAILSWLTWRALHRPGRNEERRWSRRTAVFTLSIVILYAATDEFHQLQIREKPTDPNSHSNYGAFLKDKRGDNAGAERAYAKA